MPLVSEQTGEPPRRKGRTWALGCIGGLVITGSVIAGYVGWANLLPPEPEVPSVALPNPNGYDAVNAAALRILSTPGSGVLTDSWKISPQVREAVQELQPTLNQLREALRLPFVQPALTPENEWSAPFAAYRRAASALAAEARVARYDGRHAQAMNSTLDGVELGVKTRRGGRYTHAFNGVWICTQALRESEASISKLTASEARQLGRRLDLIVSAATPLSEVISLEGRLTRIAFLRGMRRPPQLRDPDTGWTVSMDEQLRRFAMRYFFPKQSVFANLDAYFTEAEQEALKPNWQRKALTFPKHPLSNPWHAGSIDYFVREGHGRHVAILQLIRLELALQEHLATTGRLPAKLEDLVPRYVTKVDPDPFTGKPLHYRANGRRYLLYSVGPDGVDHGGTPQPSASRPGDMVAGRLFRKPSLR